MMLVVMGPLKLILMQSKNFNQLATLGQQKPRRRKTSVRTPWNPALRSLKLPGTPRTFQARKSMLLQKPKAAEEN